VYFADAGRRAARRARSLAGLCGARWVYNDVLAERLLQRAGALAALGHGEQFFGSGAAVGSHHAAIEVVASGEADCAAIDSNTLRSRGSAAPCRAASHPVARSVSGAARRRARRPVRGTAPRIASALLSMHESAPGRACLAASSVRRFAPVTPADYEPERRLLRCAALAR
jgi:ABC-type phosphate/phosphonate transport system substrate-binding protein